MEDLFADLDVEELNLDTTAEERNRKAVRAIHNHASTPPLSSSQENGLRSKKSKNQKKHSENNISKEQERCCEGNCEEESSDESELEESEVSSSGPKRMHYSQRLGRYIEYGQVLHTIISFLL